MTTPPTDQTPGRSSRQNIPIIIAVVAALIICSGITWTAAASPNASANPGTAAVPAQPHFTSGPAPTTSPTNSSNLEIVGDLAVTDPTNDPGIDISTTSAMLRNTSTIPLTRDIVEIKAINRRTDETAYLCFANLTIPAGQTTTHMMSCLGETFHSQVGRYEINAFSS